MFDLDIKRNCLWFHHPVLLSYMRAHHRLNTYSIILWAHCRYSAAVSKTVNLNCTYEYCVTCVAHEQSTAVTLFWVSSLSTSSSSAVIDVIGNVTSSACDGRSLAEQQRHTVTAAVTQRTANLIGKHTVFWHMTARNLSDKPYVRVCIFTNVLFKTKSSCNKSLSRLHIEFTGSWY